MTALPIATFTWSSFLATLQRLWAGVLGFVLAPGAAKNTAAPGPDTASGTERAAGNGQPDTGATQNGRDEKPEHEDPFGSPFSIRKLMDWLQNAANLGTSPFYRMGYKCGRDGSHHTHGVAAIEGGFNAMIHSENKLRATFGKEILEARMRIEYLEKEIARLDAETDERNPDSTAGRLRKEIRDLRDEINTHLQGRYNDRFVRDHEQIMQARKETELEFISQMKEHVIRAGEELRKTTDETEKRAKEKELEKAQENISKRYTRLASAVKSDAIAVPGSTRILLNLLFFLVVLGGEFFIIYHLYTKVLSMDAIAISGLNPVAASILRNAIFIFCVACPLALGMLVKTIISRASDRPAMTRRILRLICTTSLLMVAGMAILNPSFLSDVSELPHTLLAKQPAFRYVYAIVFFGITLLFSGVAGILYVEFIEGYEQFCNARKKAPFDVLSLTDEETFVQTRESEIQKREQEIAGLRQQREQLHQSLSEHQGLASMDLSDWNLKDTLGELKKAAVSAFRFGYQRGLSELLREKEHDPSAFLDMVYSRKLIRHYQKIFDEDP